MCRGIRFEPLFRSQFEATAVLLACADGMASHLRLCLSWVLNPTCFTSVPTTLLYNTKTVIACNILQYLVNPELSSDSFGKYFRSPSR